MSAPRKRKRTSESSSAKKELAGSADAQSASLIKGGERHTNLWYDDGNIVLSTGNMLFRVHRSILSRHSPVLADITSAYSPGRAASSSEDADIDGCPIVHLMEDSEDITHMLHGIYDYRHYADRKQLPFAVVSAWYRMGDEYEVTYLRDAALARLAACYPTTLAAYDKMQLDDPDRPDRPIAWSPSQDYDVALFAQNQALHPLLRTALYECCAGPPGNLVIAVGPGASLDAGILQRLFVGRGELARQRAQQALSFLEEPRQTCRKSSACRAATKQMVYTAYRVGMLGDSARALDCQDDFIGAAATEGICEQCRALLQSKHREGRERVWENLYATFGIPEEL
ncbi:hypothetical protein FA95DRAFT_1606922 [Auriscalpium vulgare]|uniref:Uncharacterized protein n=1 Tax=Auriscalpium vulgare TaxID=40419 RepID=A0ACB8RQ81_9AGAM|nr:hypothetical protein FA95DRAFT_1606922 [Auriscalpium vulgare]